MIVLALDTCLGACSAAVLADGRMLSATSETMERGHQERLGLLVRETMAKAGVGFGALSLVAVTTGPGSFTGLRVGIAFAKGLALTLNVPIAGVGTLPALAGSTDAAGVVIAAVDAKRGQVWLQAFRDGRPLGPAEAPDWDAAPMRTAEVASDEAITVIGSAAEWTARDLPKARIMPLAAPDPVVVGRLGARAAPDTAPPTPIYLRAPDATPKAA